jgi:hypothetical protein
MATVPGNRAGTAQLDVQSDYRALAEASEEEAAARQASLLQSLWWRRRAL